MKRMRTMLSLAFIAALLLGSGPSFAAETALRPDLAPLAFLVGTWTGSGTVAETGGISRGTVTFTVEAGGAVLLRRDHTDLFGKDGARTTSFEQLMTIYAEKGALRADYLDGDHVIHYVSSTVEPGTGVSFSSLSPTSATAPTFRLTFTLQDPRTLAIRFESAPPGETTFHPIATGIVHKSE